MEWTKIDVESDKDITEEVGGLADLKVGLDTDAESMHREFMRGLPHLCLLYTSPSPRDY